MTIQVPDRLKIFASTPKRLKIMIGGRGSGKSESTASFISGGVAKSGCRAVCCREFQTSIKQSVHSLVKRKILDNGLPGFTCGETEINHANGGQIIYQGLSRDPEAIKSVDNARLCWVEEAQTLSDDSLEKLTPSIRAPGSEIWFTANLGSSKDPFSQKFIKPFEKELRRDKYYEDDLHLIIWINYDENPWFPIELQKERLHDKETLSPAAYDHKWLGEYNDTVENAIILPHWFDACVDAHEVLGFKAQGVEVVSHDPSDEGNDPKGLVYRHGNVILGALEEEFGDINEGGDWAADYVQAKKPDVFIWDGDGLGIGLKRQFNQEFAGKNIRTEIFRGSSSVDNPDQIYHYSGEAHPKTNENTFRNKRAQYYWMLRDMCFRTWQAVNKKAVVPQDEMISFSSDIENLDMLRAELCRIPLKPNVGGYIQIMNKQEMRSRGIDSPNMADALMMSLSSTTRRVMEMRPAKKRANIA
jgi:phage terminase large subunit